MAIKGKKYALSSLSSPHTNGASNPAASFRDMSVAASQQENGTDLPVPEVSEKKSFGSRKTLWITIGVVSVVAIGLAIGLGVYFGVYHEPTTPVPTLCDQEPCLNGGECTLDDLNGYLCTCQPGFTGRHCQVDTSKVLCEDLGGCCVSWRNDTVSRCSRREDNYRCYCDEECLAYGQCCVDFKEYCEYDSCRSAPCLNGASCIVDPLADYQCLCQEGFAGRNCEVDKSTMLCSDLKGCCVSWKNDTETTSCSNIHPIAPYRCYCDDDCIQTDSCCYDFKTYCEWDPCKTSPCENGGVCQLNTGVTGYICVCSEPHTGSHCQVNKNNYLCAELGGCCIGNSTEAVSCSRSTIGYRCYCDETCKTTNDCCVDYDSFCLAP